MIVPDGSHAEIIPDMVLIHTMFRREFGLLPALVRGVAAGDENRSVVVAEHIELLVAALHSHHHSEDEYLWPRALGRAPEEVASVVHLMERQHVTIEDGNAVVAAATAAWRAAPTVEARGALADALDHLVPRLMEHMGVEEQSLPDIERCVTPAEWQEVVAHTGAGMSPEQVPLILGMAFYEGDHEVVEATLSRLPPEVRSVIEESAPKAFAAHSEVIHGTATPPRIIA